MSRVRARGGEAANGDGDLYAMPRQGVAAPVTSTVESLTGKPTRDFAAFARDHAHLFAPSAVGAGR